MSRTLDAKLLLADQTFLTTLSGGTTAVDAFTRLWADIEESLEQAIEQKSVSTATLTLARRVTDRVQLVTERFLELYDEMDAFSPALFELKSLFNELSLDEESKAATYKPVIDDITATLSSIPPYIKPAYAWLLENLHNPYPRKEIKTSIAEETGSSLTYVENWFRDVRKRIGWTTLCRTRFSNKRSLIVHAATRCFKAFPNTLKSYDLTNTPEFDQEFYQIESNAKQLYEGKLRATSLAINIESTIKESTPSQERISPNQGSATLSNPSLSYPSPLPSPQTPSPILLSTPLSTPKAIMQSSGGTKRRERSPDFDDDDEGQPRKRSRNSSMITKSDIQGLFSANESRGTTPNITHSETTTSLSTSLPVADTTDPVIGKRKRSGVDDKHQRKRLSPFHDANGQLGSSGARGEHSADESHQGSATIDPPTLPNMPTLIPSDFSARKRKRRLSDSNNGVHPKRPHNSLITPRLQAVSDPLPIPRLLTEEWWQADLPTDLTATENTSLSTVDIFSQAEPLDIQFSGYHDNLLNIPALSAVIEDTQNNWPSLSPNSINLEAIDPFRLANLPGQQGSKDLFSIPGPLVNLNNETYNLLADSFNAHGLSSQMLLPDNVFTQFPITDDMTSSAFTSFSSFDETRSEWTSLGPLLFPTNIHNNSTILPKESPSNSPTASQDEKTAKHERAKRLREELQRLEADLATECQPQL